MNEFGIIWHKSQSAHSISSRLLIPQQDIQNFMLRCYFVCICVYIYIHIIIYIYTLYDIERCVSVNHNLWIQIAGGLRAPTGLQVRALFGGVAGEAVRGDTPRYRRIMRINQRIEGYRNGTRFLGPQRVRSLAVSKQLRLICASASQIIVSPCKIHIQLGKREVSGKFARLPQRKWRFIYCMYI